MKNTIYIIYGFIILTIIAAIYYIYKLLDPFRKVSTAYTSVEKVILKVADKAENAITEIMKPIDPHLTEEEKKEYKETFIKESVKNILNPSEWLNNISYWWS